jgi:hypothetical protein
MDATPADSAAVAIDGGSTLCEIPHRIDKSLRRANPRAPRVVAKKRF